MTVKYSFLNKIDLKKNRNLGLFCDENFNIIKNDNLGLPNKSLITNLIKNNKNQKKSILTINSDLQDLIKRSNEGSLIQNDFNNGTFSVSSVGNIGGKYFVPTILRPASAIIAIGKSHKIPKYNDDDVDNMWEASDCITADHRIIDGASVARFS